MKCLHLIAKIIKQAAKVIFLHLTKRLLARHGNSKLLGISILKVLSSYLIQRGRL